MFDMLKQAVAAANNFGKAIADSLFGPESHASIRYEQQGELERLRAENQELKEQLARAEKHLRGY